MWGGGRGAMRRLQRPTPSLVSPAIPAAFRAHVLGDARPAGTGAAGGAPPIVQLGSLTLIHIRRGDVRLVAATRANANAAAVLSFLSRLVAILTSYFGGEFNEVGEGGRGGGLAAAHGARAAADPTLFTLSSRPSCLTGRRAQQFRARLRTPGRGRGRGVAADDGRGRAAGAGLPKSKIGVRVWDSGLL